MALLLLGGGLAMLALTLRLRERSIRAAGQGIAILLAVAGGLIAFRHPGAAFRLPGHGPRRWHQP